MVTRRDLARCGMGLAMLPTLAGLGGCARVRHAPDVGYTLLDGTKQRLADLRGQVVLVNFWATTCSVCLVDMPRLVALHHQFSAQGFRTLAVAMRHDAPARVADYAQAHRLPFSVVIDNLGEVAAQFNDTRVTPTGFLIDRQGRIVLHWIGEPDFTALRHDIETRLREA